jgi:hypothetical protein
MVIINLAIRWRRLTVVIILTEKKIDVEIVKPYFNIYNILHAYAVLFSLFLWNISISSIRNVVKTDEERCSWVSDVVTERVDIKYDTTKARYYNHRLCAGYNLTPRKLFQPVLQTSVRQKRVDYVSVNLSTDFGRLNIIL